MTVFPYGATAQEAAPTADTEQEQLVSTQELQKEEPQEVLMEETTETETEKETVTETEPEEDLVNFPETIPETSHGSISSDVQTTDETITTSIDGVVLKEEPLLPKKLLYEREISGDIQESNETITPSFNLEESTDRDPLVKEKMMIDGLRENSAISKNFNSLSKNFVFTDENENENLIIRSDRKDYVALGRQEIFFSVTNKGESSELVNVQAYFPHSTGEVISIEQWVEDVPMEKGEPVLEEERIQCEAGWEPLVLSSDLSLTMVKRYLISFGTSLGKTSRVFAQGLEAILSSKNNEVEPDTGTVTEIPQEKTTPRQDNLQNDEAALVEEDKVELEEEQEFRVETPAISEEEQIILPSSQSVPDETKPNDVAIDTEKQTSESQKKEEIETENKTTEINSVEESKETVKEKNSSLEQRYYCAAKDLDQECRYLSEKGKTCVTPVTTARSKDNLNQKKFDTWKNLNTSSLTLKPANSLLEKITGESIKPKSIPTELSVKKATRIDRRNAYVKALEPGETGYYKMMIQFPIDSQGEFYIEAFGDKNGYGLLDPFWDSSWNYKQAVTVDNTASSEALSDYQIFINIDDSVTGFWERVQSDGKDVRFIDSTDTTELDFFMVHFDYTNKSAQFWVKVDAIPALTSKEIFLYYGNSSVLTTTSNAENTFSYATEEPRFYAVSPTRGELNTEGVSFFDNNEFTLGTTTDADWDTGATENPKTILSSEFTTGSVATSTKPISLITKDGNNVEMWSPASWQSTVFITTSFSDMNFYLMNPGSTTANVSVKKDGVEVATSIIIAGGTDDINTLTSSGGEHWRIDSDVPILVTRYSTDDVYEALLPPPAREVYGILESVLFIICLENNTNVTVYFSDNTIENYNNCNKLSPTIISRDGSNNTTSFRMIGDKPFSTSSMSLSSDTDIYTAYSLQDLDTQYAIPHSYEELRCTAPYENTTIEVRTMSGNLVTTSGDLGTNGSYPIYWTDETTRTGAHLVLANKPFVCEYSPFNTGRLGIIPNRVLNRKPTSVPPVVTLSPLQQTNLPNPVIAAKPFNFEKIPSTTPSFTFSATDTEAQDLTYEIHWDTDENFTSPITRSSASNAGFQNTDTPADTSPFNHGETIQFTIQAGDALTNGQTYWYQMRAANIDGSGDWSTKRSFTIDTSVGNSSWHQTTDAQFNQNQLSSTVTTGNNSIEVADFPKNYVKVQSGTGTFGATLLTAIFNIPTPISDPANAFVILQGGSSYSSVFYSPEVKDMKLNFRFINNSTIEVSRGSFPTFSGQVADFSIQVVEANTLVSTQAFTVKHADITSTSTTENITISSVDEAQSMVLINSAYDSTSNIGRSFFRGELTTGTNLRISKDISGGSIPLHYQVVTFNDDFVLQKGNLNMIGVGSNSNTIASVDLSRSIIFGTWSTNSTNNSAESFARFWLSSPTTINVDRGIASANVKTYYNVVQFPVGTVIQSDNNVSSPVVSGSSVTRTLSPAVDVSQSFINLTSKKTGGDSSNTVYPFSRFASSSSAQFDGGGGDNGDYTITYYAVNTNNYNEAASGIGNMMSSEISFDDGNTGSGNNFWNRVEFTANETEGDLKVQVYYSDASACDTIIPDGDLDGNSTGFDNTISISDLDTMTYSKICLKATLTEGTTLSPELLDWSVVWGAGPVTNTTIADGTNPANATVGPGTGIIDLDTFTIKTSTGTDSITALTATLGPANAYKNIGEVRITNATGSTTYFSAQTNPTSNIINFTGGTPIPVTATATSFKVRITPKSHAAMPPVAVGESYATTGTVTSFTSANTQAGTDTASATITIDNKSPGSVTTTSTVVGDGQVTINWINPPDTDLQGAGALQRVGSAVTLVPIEGSDYPLGFTYLGQTIVCREVGMPLGMESCTITGLTNGTTYHYSVFSTDNLLNYGIGMVPAGTPATPKEPSYTQSAYRLFENTNGTDVGTPLATTNSSSNLSSSGSTFRLRNLMHISGSDLLTSKNRAFKLQYAQKSGTCDTVFVGESYNDVTTSTPISFNNNGIPADGDALTSNANDPSHGSDTKVVQSYEELNNFTNSLADVPGGQDAQWDFSLKDNGAPGATSYCLRMVKSDGTLLDNYSVIPEITTKLAQSLSFSISDNTIGFGSLYSSQSRYATGNNSGSTSAVTAHTISASSSNAASGYVISVNGSSLQCTACSPVETINPIGASATLPSPGTEQYGISASVASGSGAILSPYNQSGKYAFDSANFPDGILAGTGDNGVSTYNVSYVGNISPSTQAGSYESVLTYTMTATF